MLRAGALLALACGVPTVAGAGSTESSVGFERLGLRWGYCETAEVADAEQCRVSTKGSFSLRADELTSWKVAKAACVKKCHGCANCRFVSVSKEFRDCSWFAYCDLDRLKTAVSGFYSTAVRHEPLPANLSYPGYCDGAQGVCSDAGAAADECNERYCKSGLVDAGSWPLADREVTSWSTAKAACAAKCEACASCRYISFSLTHKDCSWFADCPLSALKNKVMGFHTVQVRWHVLVAKKGLRGELPGPGDMLAPLQPTLTPGGVSSWLHAARPGRCAIASSNQELVIASARTQRPVAPRPGGGAAAPPTLPLE